MSVTGFTLPTLNLAPLAAFGAPDAATSTAAPSDSSTSGIDTIIGSTIGVLNKMVPSALTVGTGNGFDWSIGRIVAIILGFVLIAGGIIALTVSKETVINVAKTAAVAA